MYPKNSAQQNANNIANVPSSPNFPELEQKVLKYWDEIGAFKKSVEKNSPGTNGSNEFVFYDGPPFANGLPHYGHLLTGYVKDVIPRFQTMLGRRVDRRFGWDTHGLPAELEAQRELGIDNVNEIFDLGIEKFNDACRKSVLKYTDEWEKYVKNQARWVDFENDYKTLDLDYMESVIWAFSELYKKDLAYKGYKVLPYCWQDQTPLSNHELRMDDDVYQNRQDNTVTLALKVKESALFDEDVLKKAYLTVWTTTPWTLPTNFAIAINPEIDYCAVDAKSGENAGKVIVIAKNRIDAYSKELGVDDENNPTFEIVKTFKGKDLLGTKYHPAFDYFEPVKGGGFEDSEVNLEGAFEVYPADYVGDGDGTGLVHIAPYGEDDMVVLGANSIIPPVPMDEGAILTAQIKDYCGMHVFEANKPILDDFKNGTGSQERIAKDQRAFVLRTQSLAHSYPHCWRCRKPLIYRPISSWFVKVTQIKNRLLELNEKINWIPENVKAGQFGKWLEGARDWSISRNRFWGAPIPVWVSDNSEFPNVEVYGSIAELEEAFKDCLENDADAKAAYPTGKIDDLHRPKIDTLWKLNPKDPSGNSKMVRITDVFDCWFESGSMPFAQVHYPFENKDWFESHFPADFIVEYIGQTRGWFYTLHIMATALFDCNAFKNVMCHGIVLGNDGQKMSKSLRNYPDVSGVFEKYGSDAMRYFLMSSSILRGGNLSVTEEAIKDTVRQTLLPLWSTYYFFSLYANSANGSNGFDARVLEAREISSLDKSDRYILAKMREFLVLAVTSFESFDIAAVTIAIRDFLDVLTNWYVRTNRQRFWEEDPNAFNTLFTILEALTRAVAPLLPLTAEEIWRGLTGGESVHFENYPDVVGDVVDRISNSVFIADENLTRSVDEVREIVSTTLSLRKTADRRVRQPLKKLSIASLNVEQLKVYEEILKTELNIKEIEFSELKPETKEQFSIVETLNVNARALGPRLGKAVQDVIKNAKAGNWKLADGSPIVQLDSGPVGLSEGEYTIEFKAGKNGEESNLLPQILSTSSLILLDTSLNSELIDEGIARDLIREIQETRKNSGLEVSDRIHLILELDAQCAKAATNFKDLIAKETLAVDVQITVSAAKAITTQKADA